VPTSSLVCEGFLGQAATTASGLGMPGMATATAEHGDTFVAAIARGSLVATQFHPEKSQDAGERLLAAWLALPCKPSSSSR